MEKSHFCDFHTTFSEKEKALSSKILWKSLHDARGVLPRNSANAWRGKLLFDRVNLRIERLGGKINGRLLSWQKHLLAEISQTFKIPIYAYFKDMRTQGEIRRYRQSGDPRKSLHWRFNWTRSEKVFEKLLKNLLAILFGVDYILGAKER